MPDDKIAGILLERRARTTTGTGPTILRRPVGGELKFRLWGDAPDRGGSEIAPTLDVKVEHSPDGTSWADLVAFTQVGNAASLETKTLTDPADSYIRASWTIVGDDTPDAATLSTNLTGTNNDLDYTADTAGVAGNSITIRYVVAGLNTPLSVSLSGTDITVNVATDGAGAATSTAAQVKTALDGDAPIAALINVANKAGNDGSGVVTALAATPLAGGEAAETTSYVFGVAQLA